MIPIQTKYWHKITQFADIIVNCFFRFPEFFVSRLSVSASEAKALAVSDPALGATLSAVRRKDLKMST